MAFGFNITKWMAKPPVATRGHRNGIERVPPAATVPNTEAFPSRYPRQIRGFAEQDLPSTPAFVTDTETVTPAEKELESARRVQASLWPQQLPQLPGFELCGHWQSARSLSGDFFDAIPLAPGKALLVVADVMGKGAPAAMLAMSLRTLIRALAKSAKTPGDLLAQLNTHLFEDLSAVEMFITIQAVLVDTTQRRITLANAGHCPALLAECADSPTSQLASVASVHAVAHPGMPLGIMESMTYPDVALKLEGNTTLVLHTDGLLEASRWDGAQFGEARALRCLTQNLGFSASELVAAFVRDVSAFRSAALPQDDITLLVLAPETSAFAS